MRTLPILSLLAGVLLIVGGSRSRSSAEDDGPDNDMYALPIKIINETKRDVRISFCGRQLLYLRKTDKSGTVIYRASRGVMSNDVDPFYALSAFVFHSPSEIETHDGVSGLSFDELSHVEIDCQEKDLKWTVDGKKSKDRLGGIVYRDVNHQVRWDITWTIRKPKDK